MEIFLCVLYYFLFALCFYYLIREGLNVKKRLQDGQLEVRNDIKVSYIFLSIGFLFSIVSTLGYFFNLIIDDFSYWWEYAICIVFCILILLLAYGWTRMKLVLVEDEIVKYNLIGKKVIAIRDITKIKYNKPLLAMTSYYVNSKRVFIISDRQHQYQTKFVKVIEEKSKCKRE